MGQTAGNVFNPDIANPQQAKWGDIDSSEKTARLIAGGTKGLAQGFQNYQNQGQMMRGRMGMPQINPMMEQQPVSPEYFQPAFSSDRAGNAMNYFKPPRGNNLSFYGDSNG